MGVPGASQHELAAWDLSDVNADQVGISVPEEPEPGSWEVGEEITDTADDH